jgi:hypothetical protein
MLIGPEVVCGNRCWKKYAALVQVMFIYFTALNNNNNNNNKNKIRQQALL